MRFDVITLFAPMFEAVSAHGITRRAHELGLWQLATWNPRDFTTDNHRTVDDRPFGGGPGMVMMAEPLAQAVDAARAAQRVAGCENTRVIALAAAGAPFTDARARSMAAAAGGVILVCGRYEGIDQRFLDRYVDEQISIGDFVLSGGEVAAMALIDAVVRHLPGAMKEASAAEESFAAGLLDGPQYTRPEEWRGEAVPAVLLSGHHADIARWRRAQALATTARVRPELIEAARRQGLLSRADEDILRACAQAAGSSIVPANERGGAEPPGHGTGETPAKTQSPSSDAVDPHRAQAASPPANNSRFTMVSGE
ncbi:MAG TPA: tRNA (guanosine(37)-N1)-methyltransferase TrmD [Burkholderiaceae bacterium]|nr:tRNA (guanosine(37)-N1)-methyltransferase TrmD [Burkholderiaceae bacterium]